MLYKISTLVSEGFSFISDHNQSMAYFFLGKNFIIENNQVFKLKIIWSIVIYKLKSHKNWDLGAIYIETIYEDQNYSIRSVKSSRRSTSSFLRPSKLQFTKFVALSFISYDEICKIKTICTQWVIHHLKIYF